MIDMAAAPGFWMLAIVGVIMTGISKSGFAGGAGVVAVPLLALVMPLPQAAALMLPLLLLMDMQAIRYYRHHLAVEELRGIVPAAIVGIALGGLCMGLLPDKLLQLSLAVVSILFALWQQLAPKLAAFHGAAWLWGGLSGLTSTLLHAGGPPINIYLMGRQLPKQQWLATAAVFFGVMNLIKVVPYALVGEWTGQLLLLSLSLVPVAWFGIWLGRVIQLNVSETNFMRVCRGLLLASGTLLLVKALV